MKKEPVITLDAITVRLRDKVYLQNTSWQINSTESWAVIGPNGAGKTTLAKSLFGGVPVVGGSITHHYGTEDSVPVYASIGYVSPEQQRGIMEREKLQLDSRDFSGNIDEVTTVEDIILGRAYRYEPDSTDYGHRLGDVANRLRIESILGRNILSISSGEMTKTLIARALLKKPHLLILDEPYDGLDHQSRRSLKAMLESLIDDHIQVVLITHRFEEIMSNISHVLLLKNGSVYRSGKRDEILTKEMLDSLYRSENSFPAEADRFSFISDTRNQNSPGRSVKDGKAVEKVLIKMIDTTVRFKDVTVLDKVNWTVRHGDNWMILGPNGAGKTTLLKLVLGENQQAYANEIYLFGRKKGSGESVWDIKKNIGFISSELQVRYPGHLSAFDVVCSGFFDSIGLYRLCSGEQKDMARAWIDTLGIASLADQKFGQLSHGQCQLVLIARAMVKSPVLLMLDEPCDGLDIANRDRLMKLLDIIGKNTDTNLIYVTHHKAEMIPCITHVLSLDRGKIVRITTDPKSI
ncbi:MAG: molybdate ABC transporter ATP-binding protein ModF [Deltaproteobacteria bacterium]|nr:MAG: molybdate ABC transporter ATP-binding protein ModF [Deltaproteobacteria bacterium]